MMVIGGLQTVTHDRFSFSHFFAQTITTISQFIHFPFSRTIIAEAVQKEEEEDTSKAFRSRAGLVLCGGVCATAPPAMKFTNTEFVLAGLCAGAASVLSLVQIFYHLRWYSEPYIQRFIIRIILMVPLYACLSFASLLHPNESVYLDAVRDCYEAYVIYNFISLLYAYVGGPGAIAQQCEGVIVPPSCAFCTCCLPVMEVDGTLLRRVKQGAIQFVVLKPIITLVIIVLEATNSYCDGDFSPECGYLWVQILYNVSYTLALYALLVFYLGAHDALEPYSPLLKFVLVKAVVFLTFWQGLFLAVVAALDKAVEGRQDSDGSHKSLQSFLICLEMFLASVMMAFAFPWRENRLIAPPEIVERGALESVLRSAKHAIRIGDVFEDTYSSFSQRYQAYILPPTDERRGGQAGGSGDLPGPAPATVNGSSGDAGHEFVYRKEGGNDAAVIVGDGTRSDRMDASSSSSVASASKKAKRISSVFLTREQRKHTEKSHDFSVRTFVLKGQEMRGLRPPVQQSPPPMTERGGTASPPPPPSSSSSPAAAAAAAPSPTTTAAAGSDSATPSPVPHTSVDVIIEANEDGEQDEYEDLTFLT